MFGGECDWALVEQGYDLARRAIGYALEDVPLGSAVPVLVEEAASRDALRVAYDYLAYTRFEDVPLREQVEAFILLEDACAAYDRGARRARRGGPRALWRRVRSWLDASLRSLGDLVERSGGDPFSGPMLPV